MLEILVRYPLLFPANQEKRFFRFFHSSQPFLPKESDILNDWQIPVDLGLAFPGSSSFFMPHAQARSLMRDVNRHTTTQLLLQDTTTYYQLRLPSSPSSGSRILSILHLGYYLFFSDMHAPVRVIINNAMVHWQKDKEESLASLKKEYPPSQKKHSRRKCSNARYSITPCQVVYQPSLLSLSHHLTHKCCTQTLGHVKMQNTVCRLQVGEPPSHPPHIHCPLFCVSCLG